MLLLIGSAAYRRHVPNTQRPVRDLDFIGRYEDVHELLKLPQFHGAACMPIHCGRKLVIDKNTGPIIEVEIAWPGTTADALLRLIPKYHNLMTSSASSITCEVAPFEVLYALKMSHRYLRNSPHFIKTRDDIIAMRELGATIEPKYEEWFKERERETYNYDHPNLSQSKKSFFTDNVRYVYDHDSIHESVKLGVKPAYSYFIKDGAQVAVDKSKWDKLPYISKLNSVIEEAMVLSLERSQILHPGKLTPERSYVVALQKVCTSITSGWWREFAWENYDTAINNVPTDYCDKFWRDVNSGKVILHG